MIYIMWITIIGLLLVPPVLIARLQVPYVPHPQQMTEVEKALKILNLNMHATENDVREAHRKLIMTYHPDAGGDKQKASLVNRARDILLKSLEVETKQAA